MKKLLSLSLAILFCAIVLSPVRPAFAIDDSIDNDYSISTTTTLEPNRENPSPEEGFEILLDLGHTFDFADAMSEDDLEFISECDVVTQTVTYYAEYYDLEDESFEIQAVSIDDFLLYSLEDLDALPSNFVNRVIPEEYFNRSGSSGQLEPQVSLNGGNLIMLASVFQNTSAASNSRYCVVAEFAWTKLPNYRGHDYLSIARGSNTCEIPNSFTNYISYKQYRYLYQAGPSWVTKVLHSIQTVTTTRLANQDSSHYTFTIKYDIPFDTTPPPLFPGQSFLGCSIRGLRGGVAYSGILESPSQKPQYFNHWATYLHQKKNPYNVSISINYPLGASISITSGSGKYSAPITITMLNRWG